MNELAEQRVKAALRHYDCQKRASKRYYHAHKEEINERRMELYREKHPNPRPRGRPRKVVVQEDATSTVSS